MKASIRAGLAAGVLLVSLGASAGTPPTVEIHEIQGAGLASPLVGMTVRVEDSVVTAVTSDGFFLQTPDARLDSKPALTSNGIRVQTAGAPTYTAGGAIAVGHRATVTGAVSETGGETRLVASNIVQTGSGAAMPAAVELSVAAGRPRDRPDNLYCFSGLSNFECFEGMRVTLPQGVAATGNTTAPDAFGYVYISPLGTRPLREKGVRFGATLVEPAGSDDGNLLAGIWDGNPEVLRMDADRLGAVAANTPIAGGARFSATGVLAFEGDYTLLPQTLSFQAGTNTLPVAVGAASSTDRVRIATFDLTALCDATAGNTPQPCATPEPTAGQLTTQLARQSAYIADVLNGPAVVAVQNVENAATLTALADALSARVAGSNYDGFLVEGSHPRGLDVGFLVDVNRIDSPTVSAQLTGATDPVGGGPLHPSAPLLLSASFTADGPNVTQAFRVLNVSMVDRTGVDSNAAGARQRRFAQAHSLATLVQSLHSDGQATTAPVIVAGKMHGWEATDGYVDVVGLLRGTYFNPENLLDVEPFNPVTPLLFDTVMLQPQDKRVTAVVEENFGAVQGATERRVGAGYALDHILLSFDAQQIAMSSGIGRGNADAALQLRSSGATAVGSSAYDGLTVDLEPACRASAATNTDGDNWCNLLDNCPAVANNDQLDKDGDFQGDICDPDIDGDGVPNGGDNCPTLPNPDQSDLNDNGIGDVCDDEADGDGVPNASDNCPLVANPGQEDFDNDNKGDACDPNADVTLALSALPSPVSAGGAFALTATIDNDGPQVVSSAGFTLTMPAQARFDALNAAGWTCDAVAPGTTAAVLNCTRASLAVGTANIVVSATASETALHGSTLDFQASITPEDTNTANNADTLAVPVQVGETDLRLTVFPPSPEVEVNDVLDFTIAVNNLGQRDADVVFSLPRPAGTSFTAISGTGWTCPAPSPSLEEVVCTRNIAAGGQGDLAISLTVGLQAQGTTFHVVPVVGSSVPDPDGENNTVDLAFTVAPVDLRVFANGFETVAQ